MPRTRLELARANAHYPLKVACLPISPPGQTLSDRLLCLSGVMEAMIASKKKLSSLHKNFEFYPQVVVNLRVSDKRAVTNNEEVKRYVSKANDELAGNGRLLIRASGTEPVIRIMCEAKTQDLCNKYAQKTERLIREMGLLQK